MSLFDMHLRGVYVSVRGGYISVLFILFVFILLRMDALRRFCVSVDMSKDEFVRRLCGVPEDLSTVREDLFKTAIKNGLADMGWGGGKVVVGGKQ